MCSDIDNTKLVVVDNISVVEFCRLRDSVGFQKLNVSQAKLIISHTTRIVAVKYNDSYIGVARILFDYGTDAYITDVIVDPKYQGYGVGGLIIKSAIEYIKENALDNIRIACSLYANKDKENFYNKYGFEKLPNDKYGYGMILEID